MLDRQDCLKRF